MSDETAHFAFFGAAPDTTNRGVSALFRCVVEGVGTALPLSRLWVFDNGRGFRESSIALPSGDRYRFGCVGGRGGRRYYAAENLASMASMASLGSRVARLHPILRLLSDCRAVLDVSGGDSFSDIYGQHRFWSIVRPKLIAARCGIPLILLPQTYGPFNKPRNRRIARQAVHAARVAWARDPRSFEALKNLAGESFDPQRHREGVDMAFNLTPSEPEPGKLDREMHAWLEGERKFLLAGVNVSGLVALNADEARSRFSLRADYVGAILAFIERLLASDQVRLLLVPHVMSPPGSPESDSEACNRILRALPGSMRSRVHIAPTILDEREVKWLISKLDWFCGTRMHATIAALSSCVPTATVAYSDKTRGVFETCNVGDEVIDPRILDTRLVVDRLLSSWSRREETKAVVTRSIDEVKRRATEQFAAIVREMVIDPPLASRHWRADG